MSGKIRIDKWLWYARVVKTRSRAQNLIKTGRVRVNTVRVTTPSRVIEPGDVLTVTLERKVRVLRMIAPGVRRGPAPEARELYEDLTPPPPSREEAETRPAKPAVREDGSGRPTKKQRRDLDKFRQRADGEL